MPWFTPKSPVSVEAATWIETSIDWCFAEFEPEVLAGPVLLPDAAFFPAGYTRSAADVELVLAKLCSRMGVDRDRIDLELTPAEAEPGELSAGWGYRSESSGVAGHYLRRGERFVVAVSEAQLAEPVGMIAVIAHELAHVRLLGEERIDPERHDGEQLTDLLTVALGLGVFNANASFEFQQSSRGWRRTSLGYLSEPMFGYALACYARRRHEADPPWAEGLDLNPRIYLKRSLRYLER